MPYQRKLFPVLPVALIAVTDPPTHTDEAGAVGFDGLGLSVSLIVSELLEQPTLSVLITNNFVLSVNVLLITLVKSLFVPKYHFIESLLFKLVIDNFKESPGQKERLVVEKIGLANSEQSN